MCITRCLKGWGISHTSSRTLRGSTSFLQCPADTVEATRPKGRGIYPPRFKCSSISSLAFVLSWRGALVIGNRLPDNLPRPTYRQMSKECVSPKPVNISSICLQRVGIPSLVRHLFVLHLVPHQRLTKLGAMACFLLPTYF